MNVLFLTLLDFSTIEESGIYTDLLREFVKNEHMLYIVSPTEKTHNESTKLLGNGTAKILKMRIGNMQKTSFIEKGISTLTLELKIRAGIKKYFNGVSFDLVLYSTPPITLQKTIKYVKRRNKAKTFLLLKDIFPQNAVDLGILKKRGISKVIYKYFRNIEKRLYEISDYIGCMSEANVNYLLKQNPSIPAETVEVCPNSIEPKEIVITEGEKKLIRDKYNLPSKKTIFIYGGNLGKPQGIDFLIQCIEDNEKKDKAFFLIVGSGTEYRKLSDYFTKDNPKNSMLIKQLPKKDYEILVNSCDVGLIFLDKCFTIPNFPSRLLSYMQASMPVLAATDVNTDIGQVITGGKFGYWCESGDLNQFSKLVDKICDKKLRKELGQNARLLLEEKYTAKQSYEIIMNHFIETE